ncbi:hypothetical protein [Porphyrobacter sp. YT40]|uniref:hypothetical protein n=1 Tax=Porphyrobacter sp. YT40 TaxID=2547601 RepID=UPI001141FB87|nr:hypothetical protein [Porphyrobacter sp. YT40]QDH34172.1 hypothetical protein E2E27_07445 [Porphyrobacter sp. YT40]
MIHFKDAILDNLAARGNVAQFVAFRPDGGKAKQSYSRIAGYDPNLLFLDNLEAIEALLAASVDQSVNVRSYLPSDPRSREFVYGIRSAPEALAVVERLTAEGLFTIVNETVDVSDGGVSGVLQGHVFEFAPDDTPRCVEKPGTASLPFDKGIALLELVYGFRPDLDAVTGDRTEFSIHPRPMGWKGTHTLLWEHESGAPALPEAAVRWPNNFSRMIGDKAYGLLVAHLAGACVPRTLAIPRRIAPFNFGLPTHQKEVWTRTCPTEQQPGLYTTLKGWTDPFALLQREDPEGTAIASILVQDAVAAGYSGAAIATRDNAFVIEGVKGEGDGFMAGQVMPVDLPANIRTDVENLNRRLTAALGPVRFEWVHDGKQVWCVQLHQGSSISTQQVIVDGVPDDWAEFDAAAGLSALRSLLAEKPKTTGFLIIGEIGLTSHVADVLRKDGRPSRLFRPQ